MSPSSGTKSGSRGEKKPQLPSKVSNIAIESQKDRQFHMPRDCINRYRPQASGGTSSHYEGRKKAATAKKRRKQPTQWRLEVPSCPTCIGKGEKIEIKSGFVKEGGD